MTVGAPGPLLLPVVALQGWHTRWTTERLPPAAGTATGRVDPPAGEASTTPVWPVWPVSPVVPGPLRVCVLGESTAAGCGVSSHDDGFAGALAREVAARSGRSVRWRVVGQNSATLHRVRTRLLPVVPDDLDVAVLLVGVNDVLAGTPPAAWSEDLDHLLRELSRRAARVAVAGIPPFERFPSLPRLLARFLAARAAALDAASRTVCARFPHVVWMDSARQLPAPAPPGFFARDGFHPSAVGYRWWAGAAADMIVPEPSTPTKPH